MFLKVIKGESPSSLKKNTFFFNRMTVYSKFKQKNLSVLAE